MSAAETPAPSLLTALVTNRRQVAIGLGVAGVLLAALAIWWGVWGFARSGERGGKADGKVVFDEPRAAEQPEDPRPRKSPDYRIACVWAGGLAALVLLSAAWVYTRP